MLTTSLILLFIIVYFTTAIFCAKKLMSMTSHKEIDTKNRNVIQYSKYYKYFIIFNIFCFLFINKFKKLRKIEEYEKNIYIVDKIRKSNIDLSLDIISEYKKQNRYIKLEKLKK